MNAVIDWIKTNVVTVVFLVVMIAALGAIPFFAGSLNTQIEEDMKDRVQTLSKLNMLEKSSITINGEQKTVLVTERLLEQYQEVTEAQKADADAIVALATEHNRKSRGVIMEGMFPEPPISQREVMPKKYHGEYIKAHEMLLEDINASMPPTLEDMNDRIERQRVLITSDEFQKNDGDALTEDEQTELTKKLTDVRINAYATAADSAKIFVDLTALNLAQWDQSRLPGMDELYEWQWRYWIHSDILHALSAANGETPSVLTAPVKRVTNISLYERGFVSGGGGGGGGGGGRAAPGPGGASAGMSAGMSAGGGGRSGAAAAPVSAKPADPKKEAKLDYNVSFTGRMSNPLYDVRLVQVDLIVTTARLPEVLDAIARENFMTVLSVKMQPEDPFSAARDGFIYGLEPVSRVSLVLETIWLRSWTSQFMPVDTKYSLGVPVPAERPAS